MDPQYFDAAKQGFPAHDPELDLDSAIEALRDAGATIDRNVDTGDFNQFFDAEFTVLLFEFKVQIPQCLHGLRHTKERTLADLIAFNRAHCHRELAWFGQEVFEASEATSGDLRDPEYLSAVRTCRTRTRAHGIDTAFAQHRLDAVIGPTFGFISSTRRWPAIPISVFPLDTPKMVDRSGCRCSANRGRKASSSGWPTPSSRRPRCATGPGSRRRCPRTPGPSPGVARPRPR